MANDGAPESRLPTYHDVAKAEYILPNDSVEHTRLETQARHLAAIMGGMVIHSPVQFSSLRRTLDVGCGTGVMTTTMAEMCPNAEVLGLDLSAVPALRDAPPNVHYALGDFALQDPDEWQYAGGYIPTSATGFDLIFSRLLVCSGIKWPTFIKREFNLLSPGGWMEAQDLDWVWLDASGARISDTWEWLTVLREAAEARGLDFECGSKMQERMKEAGFVDIKCKVYRWPYGGAWETTQAMREHGDYVAAEMPELLHLTIPKTLEGRGYSDQQIDRFRADMRRDFQPEEGKHWRFYVTVGRKPELKT